MDVGQSLQWQRLRVEPRNAGKKIETPLKYAPPHSWMCDRHEILMSQIVTKTLFWFFRLWSRLLRCVTCLSEPPNLWQERTGSSQEQWVIFICLRWAYNYKSWFSITLVALPTSGTMRIHKPVLFDMVCKSLNICNKNHKTLKHIDHVLNYLI